MARTLQWPIDFDGAGRTRTIEQNTLAEVQQGINMRLRVRRGSLPFDPGFGRPMLTYSPDVEGDLRRMLDDPEDGAVRAGSYELTVNGGAVSCVVQSVNTYPEAAF